MHWLCGVFMRNTCFTLIVVLLLPTFSFGQQPSNQTPPAKQPPVVRTASGFIPPADVNVRVEADVRTLVVMAAINLAGFDYETGGQPLSPARAELRRDLAALDPVLKDRLAKFYKANRRAGVDEGLDASRYAALSLLMTQPPAFTIFESDEEGIRSARSTPVDLRPLVEFSRLASEFYVKSKIKDVLSKYLAVGQAYATAYRQPIGELIYQTVEYLKLQPETTVSLRPLVIGADEGKSKDKKSKSSTVARTRTRQVFIVPDPFAAIGSSFVRDDILNQKDDLLFRRVGDDYVVIIGPSRLPNLDASRQVLIRFIIEPMIERHLRKSLEYKDQITQLTAAVPGAQKEFSSSVYLVLRESLAQAVEARMRRLQTREGRGGYSEDDAVYDLAQAYQRGAVLSFHFYQSLIGLEKVGIGIEEFFDEMLATTKFDREALRAKEFEPTVARVMEARKTRTSNEAEIAHALASTIAGKLVISDDLIRQRNFEEARNVLQEILNAEPKNARALYGMAQVTSSIPSSAERDPKADEDDKIQGQHERLELAIKLFRQAIDYASRETDAWLIQWSHVFIGRILDFQEFRVDAIAEYEKAIAMGNLPNGAFKEAQEGKLKPFGQK